MTIDQIFNQCINIIVKIKLFPIKILTFRPSWAQAEQSEAAAKKRKAKHV